MSVVFLDRRIITINPMQVANARAKPTQPAVPSTAPRATKYVTPTASQPSNHGANSMVIHALKKLGAIKTRSLRGKNALSVETNPMIATIRKVLGIRQVLPAAAVRQNWNLF